MGGLVLHTAVMTGFNNHIQSGGEQANATINKCRERVKGGDDVSLVSIYRLDCCVDMYISCCLGRVHLFLCRYVHICCVDMYISVLL